MAEPMFDESPKHGASCPCLICLHCKQPTAAGMRARVTRAFMREWGVNSPTELPDEILGAVCFWVGVSAGRFDRAHAVNSIIQKGYNAGKAERDRLAGQVVVTDDMAGDIKRMLEE